MQTAGAMLLTVRRCSMACMWMLAQGSRTAYRFLYFAAVHDGRQGNLAVLRKGGQCCG
jgi:hypothetical protein